MGCQGKKHSGTDHGSNGTGIAERLGGQIPEESGGLAQTTSPGANAGWHVVPARG